MEPQATPQPANRNSMIIGVVIATVVILFIFGLIVLSRRTVSGPSMENTASAVQPTPTTALPTIGTISLSAAPSAKVGQATQVVVKGDSEGKGVVGFDILITYDPTLATVNQITPLTKLFQISSFTKQKGKISITGTKTAGGQLSETLLNVNLLNIAVTPLKTGAVSLDLQSAINNEKTKFVDSANQQYAPKLESLKLDVL